VIGGMIQPDIRQHFPQCGFVTIEAVHAGGKAQIL
jgi:hypothetical protein